MKGSFISTRRHGYEAIEDEVEKPTEPGLNAPVLAPASMPGTANEKGDDARPLPYVITMSDADGLPLQNPEKATTLEHRYQDVDITTTISAPKPSMLDNARSYQNSDPYAPIVRGKAGDQRPVRKGRMRSTPTKPAFTGMTHDSPDKVIGSSSNKFWHGVGLHWHNQFSRCRGPRGPVLIFVVFGILIALVVVTYVSFKLVHAPRCMGAPYLYVTLHSAGNAFKFSRDGCLVTEKVLWHGNQNTKYFRQVTLGQYEDSPVLYAAAKDEVLMYGQCSSWSAMRSYKSTVMSGLQSSPAQNMGAIHAYSITQDDAGNVYASFQNTNVVLRYAYPRHYPDGDEIAYESAPMEKYGHDMKTGQQVGFGSNQFGSFEPAVLPEAVLTAKVSDDRTANKFDYEKMHANVFPGTFVQIGIPGEHNSSYQGVRGIEWVPPRLSKDSVSVNATAGTPPTSVTSSARRLRVPSSNQLLSQSALPVSAGGAPSSPAPQSTPPDTVSVQQVIVFPTPKPDSQQSSASSADLSTAGHLWIAVENKGLISIVDSEAFEVHTLAVQHPISIHYDPRWNLVFIGSRSKRKNGKGKVYAYDAHTAELKKTFQLIGSRGLTHPTGIASHEDVLYVGDQDLNMVVSFNITTKRFLSTVFKDFSTPIEHIELSPC